MASDLTKRRPQNALETSGIRDSYSIKRRNIVAYGKIDNIMLNIISYVRVSTRNQDDYGDSLNAQTKQIVEFCKVNELFIWKRFSDVGTARNEDEGSEREGFRNAIELALKKKWPIIVASADRFTRTDSIFEDFIRRGGKLYAADSGFGVDEAVMRGKIAAAKAKGDFIAKNTKRGQREAVKNGKKLGNPNIAEARKKAVAVRSRNQEIRLDEFSRHYAAEQSRGARSDMEIADAFNRRGYVTAQGKRWSQENVRRMRRAMQAGARTAQGRAVAAAVGNCALSNEGHPPAFGEPPIDAPSPVSRDELVRKYPDPGHPAGSIVDEERRLTPEALARLAHLIARYHKNLSRVDPLIGTFRRLTFNEQQAGRVQRFLDRKFADEVHADPSLMAIIENLEEGRPPNWGIF